MVGLPAAPILSWTILLAPLCAAVLVLLCGIHRPRLSASLVIAGLLLSVLCTGRLVLHAVGHHGALPFETSVVWMATPGFTVPFGVLIDQDYRRWDRMMDNCAISELVFEPTSKLISFNRTDHLPSESSPEE